MADNTDNLWEDPNDFAGITLVADPPSRVDDLPTPMIGPDLGLEDLEPEPISQPHIEPAPEPEDDPIVIQNPDGSSISIEKSGKGWKGSVDNGTGSTQDYYGKTKNDLLQNVLKAQLNATKKIREQNRQIKFGISEAAPVEPVQKTETAKGRKPTADELAEIKLLQETDPDAAWDKMFLIKTGRTPAQLVSESEQGRQASLELSMESAAKQFVARNPDYYADPNFENYQSILAYLAKRRLRRTMTKDNAKEIEHLLVSNGHFTVQNLEEAYTELKEDGLLLAAPPPPKAPEPPQPTEPRIVRTETRPRAGYGIRQSETTQTRIPEPTPPSALDLDSLSTEEINKLYEEATRLAIRQRSKK